VPIPVAPEATIEPRGSSPSPVTSADPGEIEMPTTLVEEEKTRWRELFRYPRSMAAACTIAPSQRD
jgi:hypothetical protein